MPQGHVQRRHDADGLYPLEVGRATRRSCARISDVHLMRLAPSLLLLCPSMHVPNISYCNAYFLMHAYEQPLYPVVSLFSNKRPRANGDRTLRVGDGIVVALGCSEATSSSSSSSAEQPFPSSESNGKSIATTTTVKELYGVVRAFARDPLGRDCFYPLWVKAAMRTIDESSPSASSSSTSSSSSSSTSLEHEELVVHETTMAHRDPVAVPLAFVTRTVRLRAVSAMEEEERACEDSDDDESDGEIKDGGVATVGRARPAVSVGRA